jgi:replicative DNA helicase
LTVRADAAVRGFWETYDARENRIALGVPTGLRVLDAKIGGCLQNSSLVIAAARPGNGKTAFALRVAENSAVNGMPVQIFSIEMGVQELMDRIIAGVAKVNLKHLQIHSLLTEDEKARISRAAAIVEKWPLFINDATDWTVAEMAAEARRQKRQNGIGLLIVDYLQLLEGETDSDRQSRQEQVAKMSRGLKKLAKQLDIPIMALSQLNRNCESREDKRPRLADLRESGALEQDANMVLLLHYPEKHDPETADQGIVEVNVAKHRNGETGMVRLAFVKEFSRFEMLSREQAARYEKPRYDDDNF